MNLLQLPYLFNILVLFGLVWPILTTREFSDGKLVVGIGPTAYQVLVGSLWSAILLGSIIGLFRPELMVPLLFLQIVYKALFLGFYALPNWRQGLPVEAPGAMLAIFVMIVAVYPYFVWRGCRLLGLW